jgi:hypothetical protein
MELLVAISIFLLILGLVVGIFIYGVRMFQHASLRQGLEGDARRIAGKLRRDVVLTDFKTVGAIQRVDGTLRRDALSVAALTDWNQDSNFDPVINLPLWDQFVVIYSTKGLAGKLIRQVVDVPGVPSQGWSSPYPGLGGNIQDDPSLNADVVGSGVLSNQVEEFLVTPDISENSVTIRCKLRRTGLQKAGSNDKADETMEFTLLLKTKNSWPDI